MAFLPTLVFVLFWSGDAGAENATQTADRVDREILSGYDQKHVETIDDATYLRRVSLDLIGRPATATEITRFGLDPTSDKRSRVVETLLQSDEYAAAWSRYWRDAILRRATNVRVGIVRGEFESWMADHLAQNRPWDTIVTELITATGPVNNNGATALIFAHEGEPEEIAAEVSRLFLGIQIQCANCHDHPWDRWKREQFHQLVAFFPRVSVRRDRSSDNMFDYEIASVNRDARRRPGASQFLLTRIDRNRDKVISELESKGTPLERIFNSQIRGVIDTNGDGRLSIQEIMTAQPPDNNRPGQGAVEHYMPNLENPGAQGDRIDPVFFVNNRAVQSAQDDLSRRNDAALLITSKSNPWFARAMVNRIWYELTGTAFYAPIDDMGPDREAQHAAALDILCDGFVTSGHDLHWLFRTITSTQIYQRRVDTEADGFLQFEPTRLRSDQLYAALCQVLSVNSLPLRFSGRYGRGMQAEDRGRLQFDQTFGFDPSTPKNDLTGSIPEALFLMNSREIDNLIRSDSRTSTIARVSRKVISDVDVTQELYLMALGREPSEHELATCQEYLASAESRKEGFEDILWSLVNCSEFQSKR